MSYRDPEAARAYQRAWRKAHPERVAKSRELQRLKALGTKRVRCRDKARAYHRKHLYGLTAEAYAALLDSQGASARSAPCRPERARLCTSITITRLVRCAGFYALAAT